LRRLLRGELDAVALPEPVAGMRSTGLHCARPVRNIRRGRPSAGTTTGQYGVGCKR
jgi:hypothetical protein